MYSRRACDHGRMAFPVNAAYFAEESTSLLGRNDLSGLAMARTVQARLAYRTASAASSHHEACPVFATWYRPEAPRLTS